jgi:hypothetical protein
MRSIKIRASKTPRLIMKRSSGTTSINNSPLWKGERCTGMGKEMIDFLNEINEKTEEICESIHRLTIKSNVHLDKFLQEPTEYK